MNGRKLLGSALALAVLVGFAGLGVNYLLGLSVSHALSRIRADLPAGTTLTYGQISTSLLSGEVRLYQVALTSAQTPALWQARAAEVALYGLPWITRDKIELGRIEFSDLVTSGPLSLSARTLQIDHPAYSATADLPFISGFSFAALRASSVVFEREPPRSFRLSLDRLDLGALQQGRLAAGQGEKAELLWHPEGKEDDRITLSAAKGAGNGIDLAWVAGIATTGNTPDAMPALMGRALNRLDVEQIKIQQGQAPAADIATLAFSSTRDAQGKPADFRIAGNGYVLPLENLPKPLADYCRDMGYERFTGRFSLDATYDANTRRLTMGPGKLDVEQAFEIEVGIGLAGFDLPAETALLSLPLLFQHTAALERAHLTFTERGMVDRHVKAEAKRLQVEPPVYIEQRISSLEPDIDWSGPGGKKIGQIYRALGGFLLGPGEITFTVSPPQPVPIMWILMNFSRFDVMAETLNVSAKNRRP